MATKTITIKEEAYNKLKALKGDKSFSDLIIDMTEDEDVDLSKSAGLWSDVDEQKIEEKRKEFRSDFEEKFS
jgi:predicted CopG family antitoxin